MRTTTFDLRVSARYSTPHTIALNRFHFEMLSGQDPRRLPNSIQWRAGVPVVGDGSSVGMTTNARNLVPARAGRREWWGLAALALPTLLLSVDLSVVFLALPTIAVDLSLDGVEQLWFLDIYGFLVAGFLVTMGTLGDRIGHRRLLLIGAVGFGVASALAATATNAPTLIVARAALGIAGATLAPTTLALITRMFADPRQRGIAVAVWSGCLMGGSVLGPVAGGILLSHFWWGSVFLLAVPVTAILLVAGPLLLPEHHGPAVGRLDPVSVALSLAAILTIVYAVKELARGVGTAGPALGLVVGSACAVLFVRRQRGLRDPLLELALFRIPVFRSTLLISLVVGALQGGGLLVANMYLQLVQRRSPLSAGLWLVPAATSMLIGIVVATSLVRRVRPGYLIAGGLLCSALGNLVLAQGAVIAGLCLVMAGVGPMVSLGYGIVLTETLPLGRAGSASATMETGGQLGIAVGIGALGSLAGAVYRERIALPDGLPADVAGAARESLAGAVAAAGAHRPDLVGTEVMAAANDAFMAGLSTVAVVTAVVFTTLAVVAAVSLRDLPPHQAGR
jgi:MFS transporter, DHA2 family, multidrug resistance protein